MSLSIHRLFTAALTCARTISARLRRPGAIILMGSKNRFCLNQRSRRVSYSNISLRHSSYTSLADINLSGWNQRLKYSVKDGLGLVLA